MFGFFLFGLRKGFRNWNPGDGRVEKVGEGRGTLYSALYMVFRDQNQEVCSLILPKVKADKPRIGKDGILPMKRKSNQLDMLTHVAGFSGHDAEIKRHGRCGGWNSIYSKHELWSTLCHIEIKAPMLPVAQYRQKSGHPIFALPLLCS